MNIVLATGIYPPDIGGPATYVAALERLLPEFGHTVSVVTYGVRDETVRGVTYVGRKHGVIGRYARYCVALWRATRSADCVYAHDLFSAGLPATLVTFVCRKKLCIRLGGDFLWEKAFNAGWTAVPLSRYYEEPKRFTEKVYISLARWVMRRARAIIFSTEWQRAIYEKAGLISRTVCHVIENPLPKLGAASHLPVVRERKHAMLYAGRLIRLKNIESLIRIVARNPGLSLTIIGEGPDRARLEGLIQELGVKDRVKLVSAVSHEKLAEEMQASQMVIVPSVTEISPNTVLECIAAGIPVIATQETGLPNEIRSLVLTIDPLQIKDIEEKILYLCDDTRRDAYQKRLASYSTTREWSTVVREHDVIFKSLV